MPDGTDDHTKRQRRHDLTRCPHDGLVKGKMDNRIQHEHEPSQGPPANVGQAKDFATTDESAARA